jgi:hypothetical protein
MKKYLTLSFLLFLYISSFAQVKNNLVIFNNDGEKFILILNGQKYNETPATTVRATDLILKKYQVRIIFENNKIKDHNNNITFFSTGFECVFGLNGRGKRKYTLDYVSETSIEPKAPVTNNSSNTNTNDNTYTETKTTDTYSNTNTPNTNTGNNSNSISIKAGGLNIGLNEKGAIKLGTKEGDVNLNAKDQSGNLSLGHGDDAINLNKVAKVPKVGCSGPISDVQFETLKKQISSQTSDITKLTAANALIESNCFMTSHIEQLMKLFSTDKSKLEVAKNSYSHTNDLSNYHRTKDVLYEDESKKELSKFIREQK